MRRTAASAAEDAADTEKFVRLFCPDGLKPERPAAGWSAFRWFIDAQVLVARDVR